jgi:hypothetical protein
LRVVRFFVTLQITGERDYLDVTCEYASMLIEDIARE